jgi:hypothetical protein
MKLPSFVFALSPLAAKRASANLTLTQRLKVLSAWEVGVQLISINRWRNIDMSGHGRGPIGMQQ